MIFSGLFALIVGVGMIGQWSISFVSRRIPELTTEPKRICFHIAGEMVTAITLVVSGIGLLAAAPWAQTFFLVSIGMLFYTAIVSPGYFAQRGSWIWVLIFAVIIGLGLLALFLVIRS